MAGSTKSNKRMGEMVKTVSPLACPQGYSGTPPNCKKVQEAIVTYDKKTTRQMRKKQRKTNKNNK